MKSIAVLGDGGWGTALAVLLARKGIAVRLWGAFPDYVQRLAQERENSKFLPGVALPELVLPNADLTTVCAGATLVIIAVPSQYLRAVARRAAAAVAPGAVLVSAAKGLEQESLCRMSEVIRQEIPRRRVCVLSGPNIAYEVAVGMPSAAVCAAADPAVTARVQDALMGKTFRVYTSTDCVGVEIAGVLKNVIAIACGIADGLGYGANTKGALITRGLAEMIRLGLALGARVKTFSGLSGIGDVVTTCLSVRSRNRTLGEAIGRGNALAQTLSASEMVVEGVHAAQAALQLAARYDVEMPITREVCRVLFEKKDPRVAVDSLMVRGKKSE